MNVGSDVWGGCVWGSMGNGDGDAGLPMGSGCPNEALTSHGTCYVP